MSSVDVFFLNTATTAKARLVSLPRDMTVAELQKLAPQAASLTVDGCTPAASATLGDLYDACAKNEQLQVTVAQPMSFGSQCCSQMSCSQE